jgi:Tol biopolymer transport system component
MKIPFRSLLVVSMSLLVLLGLSGCGNSNRGTTTSFAYLQEEAGGTPGLQANSLLSHPFSKAVRTHKAGKRADTASAVDIQTGYVDLYLFDTLTNRNTKLVTGYAFTSVQLSSDGTELLVGAEDSNGNIQIYLADSKFETISQLTTDASDHLTPSLSPDGTLVAYSNGNYLYTLPIQNGAAAGTATQVTATTAFLGIYPVISSDDKTIMFTGVTNDSGIFIYSVNLDTQALTQLSTGGYDLFPAISPDGKKVAFTRIPGAIDADASATDSANIVTIDIAGETTADPARTLTSSNASTEPQYVGFKIVYLSENNTDDYLNIWDMNPDGSFPMRLTNESEPEFFDMFFIGS